MNPDDPVCLCFHVTRRKVLNFIRIEKPKRPSQLSQCFGAGTGCGWCRPYLERLLEQSTESANPPGENSAGSEQAPSLIDLSVEQYKEARSKYVQENGRKLPPGATPID